MGVFLGVDTVIFRYLSTWPDKAANLAYYFRFAKIVLKMSSGYLIIVCLGSVGGWRLLPGKRLYGPR